jgi:hypothetical protein
MSLKSKILYSIDPKDLTRGTGNLQVSLKVVGIFDTHKVFWTYYAISSVVDLSKSLVLTDEICSNSLSMPANIDNVRSFGLKYSTLEEAKKYLDEFKIKWETASNNTIQEVRDKKLKELTDEKP